MIKMKIGDSTDSHTYILDRYGVPVDKHDKWSQYEYNPLTGKFTIDQSNTDGHKEAEAWVRGLDFSLIVPALIIKPIVHPFKVTVSKVTQEHIDLLKQWDSVWASVGAYISSFFDIKYKYDFSSCVKLWEAGLVPSFDGTIWRLYAGKKAKIVYEWRKINEKSGYYSTD